MRENIYCPYCESKHEPSKDEHILECHFEDGINDTATYQCVYCGNLFKAELRVDICKEYLVWQTEQPKPPKENPIIADVPNQTYFAFYTPRPYENESYTYSMPIS